MPEKAIITNTVTKEKIPVMFNPEEYTLNHDNNFASQNIPGLSAPLLQFVHGNMRTLEMELFFDTTDARTDVREETRRVVGLLSRIEAVAHRGPGDGDLVATPERVGLIDAELGEDRWGQVGDVVELLADLTAGGGFVDSRPSEGLAVEYSGFAPPTTFRLGTSYLAWQAPYGNVNVVSEFVRPADNDETARFGAELELSEGRLMLRGGYDGASDALPWSGGLGLALSSERVVTRFDYAFSQSEFFDRVDRFSIRVDF